MSAQGNYEGMVRTIVTHAVFGHSKKENQTTVYVNSDKNGLPTKILGTTIKDTKIDTAKFESFTDATINVKSVGKLELHTWYEIDGDTQVTKSQVKLSDIIPVQCYDSTMKLSNKKLIKNIAVSFTRKPEVVGSMIIKKTGVPTVAIQIEYEVEAEVSGLTKMNVLSYPQEEPEDQGILDLDLEQFETDLDKFDFEDDD